MNQIRLSFNSVQIVTKPNQLLSSIRMTEALADPLRYLNIKKKKQANKKLGNLRRSVSKQVLSQQTSRFLLPSFSSQNSLENEEANKIKKVYNPLKYFNPEIEQFLNKLNLSKIANSPVMPAIGRQSETEASKKLSIPLAKTLKNQCNQMITFSKNTDFCGMMKPNNQLKQTSTFLKPGLRKSGSMKMMQKLQQEGQMNPQISSVTTVNNGISPWQLPQNADENIELRQCEVCGRKFNLKSYEKHVKVCERVFFQKRKKFDSRSNSLDKKETIK